jgi:SAM-dependent methyltransferase
MAYSDAHGMQRAQQIYDLARYKFANQGVFADVKYRSFCRIRAALERELGSLRGKRLVEVGCGQWQTNMLLFSALGAEVLGVDPEAPPATVGGYPAFARAVGLQRAAKTAVNEAIFRRGFNRRLSGLSGLALRAPRGVHRRGGERLPAADGTVDAAFSDDVFEHLPDVDAVVAEMARVLRPGGVALIIIHPFTAYSGGHHPATMDHGAGQSGPAVAPWDHLRGNRHPSGVDLNRLRTRDYERIIASHLDITSWELHGPEGERHLIPEVLVQLGGYIRDELLVGKIICIAHKRA